MTISCFQSQDSIIRRKSLKNNELPPPPDFQRLAASLRFIERGMIVGMMRGVLFAAGLVAVCAALFLRRRRNQGVPKAAQTLSFRPLLRNSLNS